MPGKRSALARHVFFAVMWVGRGLFYGALKRITELRDKR